MKGVIFFLLFSILTIHAYAACDKLITLDDGNGNIRGYVVVNEIAGISGNDKTTHIVFRNGAGSIDLPVAITYVFSLITKACPQ